MKLEIREMLHLPTNTMCYEVLNNDGHNFPSYGVYRTKLQAQKVLKGLMYQFVYVDRENLKPQIYPLDKKEES